MVADHIWHCCDGLCGRSHEAGNGREVRPYLVRRHGEVAELVKSFEHVNEILDGFRYEMGAYPLNSTPFRLKAPRISNIRESITTSLVESGSV